MDAEKSEDEKYTPIPRCKGDDNGNDNDEDFQLRTRALCLHSHGI